MAEWVGLGVLAAVVVVGVGPALTGDGDGGETAGEIVSGFREIAQALAPDVYRRRGRVRFEHVSYSYESGGEPVLQDLDCGTRPRTLVKRAFTTALFFPLSYALESVAVLWAFVSRERCIGFQTIRK